MFAIVNTKFTVAYEYMVDVSVNFHNGMKITKNINLDFKHLNQVKELSTEQTWPQNFEHVFKSLKNSQ